MAIMFTDWAVEGRVASDLARLAGKAILEVYATRFEVRFKGPDDPVTDADLRAQDIIVEELSRAFPHDGIISGSAPYRKRLATGHASGTSIRWMVPANS
jgi:3'-phosphoadenosine 5'-phosphosulfate (PAPS) 3'-phosphatase